MFPFPDITGDNAAHQITSGVAYAKQAPTTIQIIVSGAGTVRLGDSTVSASLGLPIPAGGGMFLPYQGRANGYTPGAFYVYVPTGATVSAAAIF